jgi:hypothetical protein
LDCSEYTLHSFGLCRMEKICTTLNRMLNLSENETQTTSIYIIKSQTLSTLTTILIELDIVRTQPRAFESFIEVLFDIVSRLNEPATRLLRQTVREIII